jgi:hypothetical protein
MENELSSDLLTPSACFGATRDTSPPLTRGQGTAAAELAPTPTAARLDVRITPSGYRAYTKLMPAPLSILRTDRGLDDKQPVSLVYVSILG